ncbi:MAG: PASTA domain-containing protein, partial [Phycisphaerales bacterium]
MKLARISRTTAVALAVGLSGIVAPAVFAAPAMDVVTIHYTGVIDVVHDDWGDLDGSVEVGGFFHGAYTFNTRIEVRHEEPGWDRYLYYEKAPAGMTMWVTFGNYTVETAEDVNPSEISVRNNYIFGGGTRDDYFVHTSRVTQTAGPDIGIRCYGDIFFDLRDLDDLDGITSTALPRAMPPLEKFEEGNTFAVMLDFVGGRGTWVEVRGHLTKDAIVPEVAGLPVHEATLEVTNHELSVGEIEYDHSETVPENRVMSQAPAAGTRVPAGSAVDLWVSLGPATAEVPDVVGRPLAEAKSTITVADLIVGVINRDYSDTVPRDRVITQDPAAGT